MMPSPTPIQPRRLPLVSKCCTKWPWMNVTRIKVPTRSMIFLRSTMYLSQLLILFAGWFTVRCIAITFAKEKGWNSSQNPNFHPAESSASFSWSSRKWAFNIKAWTKVRKVAIHIAVVSNVTPISFDVKEHERKREIWTPGAYSSDRTATMASRTKPSHRWTNLPAFYVATAQAWKDRIRGSRTALYKLFKTEKEQRGNGKTGDPAGVPGQSWSHTIRNGAQNFVFLIVIF